MRRRRLAIIAVIAVAAIGVAAYAYASAGRSNGTAVVYVVPAGTAARIASGESVSILPSTILLRAGDTLVIRNEDTAPVQLGPFRIDAGQTLSHRYKTAGVYDLECTVHKDGKLTIVVR